MPAYPSSGVVFGHQHLLQLGRRHIRESGRCIPQRQQKGGNVVSLTERSFVEVVLPAEGNHPPLAHIPLKLELPERQSPHLLEQFALFMLGDEVRLIPKTFGEGGGTSKQLELLLAHMPDLVPRAPRTIIAGVIARSGRLTSAGIRI